MKTMNTMQTTEIPTVPASTIRITEPPTVRMKVILRNQERTLPKTQPEIRHLTALVKTAELRMNITDSK